MAVLVLSGLAPGPGPAGAAGGLQFLDERPVVIDLEDLPRTPQWLVRVFQGQPGGPQTLTLHVLFEPPGAVKVVRGPGGPVATGEVAEFVIELDAEEPGSGELVVTSSDGAVARRAIRTADVGTEHGILPSALRFAGTRLTPLGSSVSVDAVEVASVPPRPASEVGTVTSGRGDVARVVQSGRRFEVRGLSRPGEYEGTADLRPGAEGGDVEVTATVRDAAGWPLVVLLAGLLAVQALERYQKRVRPRRDLARRLAFLMDRARVAQDRVGGRLRICNAAGGDLYLDGAAKDALASWDRGRVAAEWSAWEVGGTAYQAVEKGVEDFRRLTEDFQRLGREREQAVLAVRPADRAAARRALDESPVGEALRPANFGSVDEIAVAAARVADGRAHLDRFADLYDLLDRLDAPAVDTQTRTQAQQVRRKVLLAGVDLEPLEKQAGELLAKWEPAVEPVAPSPPPSPPPSRPSVVIAGSDAGAVVVGGQAPAKPGAPPGRAPRALGPSRWATRTAAAVAALATLAVLVVLAGTGGDDAVNPGDPVPTTTPAAPTTIPDAPVAAPPTLPRAPTSGDDDGGGVLAWGYLAPLLLGAAVAAAVTRILRARRRRPAEPEDFDSKRLDRVMREEDRRFALASGLFVVASGMSLLYFPNDTFGSAGDYLSVALWGTAVGEGVQLARRLLPTG